MGARLVSLALMRWAHVTDRAFRVLVRMAHTALDDPSNDGVPAGLYWGGRDLLASALPPSAGTGDTRHKTLQRALADLTAAGAIRRIGGAGPRRNQVYQLTLAPDEWGTPTVPHSIDHPPVDRPPMGDTHRPPVGDTSSPEWGTPADPPRNQEEPIKELSEEPIEELRSQSAHSARARPPDNPNPHADDTCPACGVLLDPDRTCRHPPCRRHLPPVIPLAAA